MKKKCSNILNSIMAASFGVFIGRISYDYYYYQKHVDWYATQTTPWYTSSIVYGSVTIGTILVVILLKRYLAKKDV